jgi:hypothetical protein
MRSQMRSSAYINTNDLINNKSRLATVQQVAALKNRK